MTRTTNRVLAALCASAALLHALLAARAPLGRSEGPPRPAIGAGAPGETASPAPAALAAVSPSSADATAPAPAARERDSASALVPAGPDVAAEGRTARLRGRITRAGKASPARLRFRAGPNRGVELEVGADGRLESPELYPGFALLAVEVGGLVCEREVALRHGLVLPFSLDVAPRGDLRGRVTDAGGAAVAGATVALDGFAVPTDADGRFVVSRVASGDGLLVVRAPGHASVRRTVAETAPVCDVRLAPGIRVELAVGPVPGGGEVTLYVLPTAGEPLAGNPPQPAYPWHELSPLRARAGSTVVLENLPACRVELRAFHERARSRPVHAWLTAGASASLAIELEPLPASHGRLLLRGEPLAGATVHARPRNALRATIAAFGAVGARYLAQPLELLPETSVTVETDARGRFALPRAATGRAETILEVVRDGRTVTRRLPSGDDFALELAEHGTGPPGVRRGGP